jgi:glycosyltransferase involved in cell wall biosynthesis
MAPISDPAALREARRAAGATDRYVLYVGVFDPNKDLHTLLAAFARACPRLGPADALVLAGPRNWFQPVLVEEAERLGIGARVRFPGYVPDALLPALYSGAAAAVCPSPLEGFGFPALEAMACGTPVVVVDAGALPEVTGDAALRVPPRDPEAMARAIERVAADDDLTADLRKRGLARARAFSWERTAKMTLDVYRKVAG